MILDVVEALDPTGQIMVQRLPQQGSGDFTTGSQLVVQDSQIAVFYRDGRMADQFRAGRYTLSTQNLPILKTFTKLAFKGKSPFRAYVYFVNLKTFLDMGWGTPNPILFRDTEFKMVNLRAHGTFALKISDHVRFLNTIVGTQGLQDTSAIQEYLRKIVASRFASTLPGVLTTVIDLAAQYQNVEVKVKAAVRDDFGQYGLELVDLVIESITVPPEVQTIIDKGVGVRSLDADEVAKYQQVAAADALRDAAKTGGGDGLTGGLGIGAGLAMGHQFARGLTPPTQTPSAAPPPLPPSIQWYIASGGQQVGPLTPDELQARIRAAQVTRETLVWRQGMANWTQAGQLPELAPVFGAAPPPLPPGQ
ncbi:MAG: SPFH domain-containing protein [Planctomycetota bacterium]